MTPKQAGKQIDRTAVRFEKGVTRALAKEQDRALMLAIKQSSGTKTQSDLDRANNPYGHGAQTPAGRTRGPVPYGDPAKVNKRSGSLVRNWKKGGIYTDSNGNIHAPVVNNDKDAGLFDGKPHGRMRARDLGGAVTNKAEKGFSDRIEAAVRRILS